MAHPLVMLNHCRITNVGALALRECFPVGLQELKVFSGNSHLDSEGGVAMVKVCLGGICFGYWNLNEGGA